MGHGQLRNHPRSIVQAGDETSGKAGSSPRLRGLGCGAQIRWAWVLGVVCLGTSAYGALYSELETFTYHQPDGSSFSVKLQGDEYFAYQRTLDGREVILDEKTGFWCYAKLQGDGRGFVSTGVPVVTSKAGSGPANLKRAANLGATENQTLPVDAVLERVRGAQSKFRVDDKGRPLGPEVGSPLALGETGPNPAPPSRTSLGDYVGLCILIDFPDQVGTITQSQVDNYCNQPTGYTEFGNACSINEYFKIQSNGKFNFNNTVTAYVRMPQPKTYYDDNSAQNWGTAKAQELVATALDILMAQGFDFTVISRDGSGTIYSINVFYAGTCASGWSLGLWPHSWAIPTKTVDTSPVIRAYRYQMTDMENSLSIGTFCHENGHMTCLLPDLYSYVTGGSIDGYYTLMSSGNYGGGGKHPTNIDPYLKYKAGWADVVEVNSSSHVRATAQVDRNFYYKYTNPSYAQEYYLIENRHGTGYEGPYGGHLASVAPGSGLAVWHVWESGSNTYCSIQQNGTYTTPYEAFLIEATPTGSTTPWYLAASPVPDGSDTFYSGRGVNPMSDSTTPELRFWDHTGNTGRTVNSGMVVHTYAAQGAALSYTIGSGSPPATPVIGVTTSQITAVCDYGTNPANQVFQVYNSGGGTLNYVITDNAAWLTCAPGSGAVTTGSSAITVSMAASALPSGTYTATITVTDAAASNSPVTIPVTLTVSDAPVLSVTPLTVTETLWRGETSGTHSIGISNAGGGLMSYTVSESLAWLTPSFTSGSCTNESDLVYLTLDATSLAAGVYSGTVTITAAGASGSPQVVNVTLTVHDGIIVSAPNGGEYVLHNTTRAITWTSNQSTNVRIELLKGGVLERVITASTANDDAYDWPVPSDVAQGPDYRIRITTTDSAYTDSSDGDFWVVAPVYAADMTVDPGWTLSGQWAWGTPTGGGGATGNKDPVSGYTGSNVLGYNLAGDYANSLATTQWAKTPVFDCVDYTGIKLSFYRWLGVQQRAFDHAYIEISNDNGNTWNQVWQNETTNMLGGAWEYCTYDVSAWADRKDAVQVRWGMGTTNASTVYCGWNLDDVFVVGDYYPLPVYTVTYSTDGTPGATLTGTTPQSIKQGHNCTAVTANVPVGYHFVNWTLGGVAYSTSNPLTVTNVTANMALTANYAINTYTLTYTAGLNGAISGTTPQTVNHGSNGSTVTAVPNVGYHFVQWSDGVLTAARTDTNVTGNITVSASFAINTYTLTYTAGLNGTLTGTTPQTVNHGSNGSTVTAVPNVGYHFVQWSDGVLTAARTDTNVTGNITVSASFAINTYTLTYTAGLNGTLTGTTPQTVNHGSDGSTVTAVPNVGYHFVQWSDGVLTAARTDTNVTGNITVSASFAINTYTLTYTAGLHGTLTGTTPQTVNHGSDGSTVTAVPDTYYQFVDWSDGVLTAARTDTNVTGNITVTANFADTQPPTVTMTSTAPDPTNTSPIPVVVVFSEPVADFTSSDIVLTNGSVSNFAGSSMNYTFDLVPGGEGLVEAAINGGVAHDGAGNGNTAATPLSRSYDSIAPTVDSIVRVGATPSNAGSVQFTVTFSESVSGDTVGHFGLTTTGVTGASITGLSGTGATRTVTVNTGTGDGTIRLDMVDATGVTDAAANVVSNVPYTGGETYVVDKTAPTVDSIVRVSGTPSDAGSVQFTVTFSESVSGDTAGHFDLTTTGVTGASITGVSGTGATRTVTVNTGTGDGTIRLDMVDATGVVDTAGNVVSNTPFTSGESYTIDKTVPTITDITRVGGTPSNAVSVQFTVTFSEPVSGDTASHFDLTTTGVTGASITGLSGTGDTRTVTVNTGTGDGTIRLDMIDATGVTDAAGNVVSNTPFTTGQSYTIDKTVPTVTDIVRVDGSPTNAVLVQFTVTFSESVSGDTVGHFDLTTTGVSGASITGLSGTGDTRTVTVNTGTGDGTIRLDMVDATGVTDAAGNVVSNVPYTGGETYAVDKTAPTVDSIVRVGVSPSNAASVQFTVTFSESVSGGNAGNFDLTTTGVTGASITGVSGTGATRTVTVNTGTGDGTIRLDMITLTGMSDVVGHAVSNLIYTGGESYAIDKTAPTVTAIDPAGATPTNAASVQFTVTFSEAVTGGAVGLFELATTGVTGTSITGISGTGATRTVTVNTGTGDGTIRLDMTDTTGVADAVGYGLSNVPYTTGQVYVLDRTAPEVTSITRMDPNPTSAASVQFSVAFSESVTGVTAGNFALTPMGISGCSISGITGSGAAYTVTVDTGTGDGTLRLDMTDTTGVTDVMGYSVSNLPYTTGEAYLVDKAVPVVVSIVRGDLDPTSASSVSFIVTFSESVTGVASGNFDLTTTGVTGTSILGVSGTGAMRTVTVDTGTGDGTIRLDMTNTTGAADAIGNAIDNLPYTSGESYTVDKTAPTVQSITRTGVTPSNAASVEFLVTFSEPVSGIGTGNFALTVGGTLLGSVVSGVSGSGATRLVMVDTGTGDGLLLLKMVNTVGVTDGAGLGVGNLPYLTGESYLIDKTAPTAGVVLDTPSPTNAAAISFTVTFDEAVQNFDQADFVDAVNRDVVPGNVSGSITYSGWLVTPIDAVRYTVSYTGVDGTGTMDLHVRAGSEGGAIRDMAGNLLEVSVPSGLLRVDNTPPQITAITCAGPSTTNAATVQFTVTFSEAVTGGLPGNFALVVSGALTGSSITGISGTGDTRTVTVSTGTGEGVLRLDAVDDTGIADEVGNPLVGIPFTAGESCTIDRTSPDVTLSTLATSPVNGPVTVTATLSETSVSLDALMFTVNNALITGLSGVGLTYTFTLTPQGEGAFSVSLDANAFTDIAGNGNTASNAIALIYDGTRPFVTLSTVAGDPVNNSITILVSITESVSDFDVYDITATNATVTTFTGSLSSYSFVLNPLTEGSFSAVVETGHCTDTAGNTNDESNTISRTYDNTPPGVSLSSSDPNPTNGAITVTATLTESASTFDAADVSVDNAVVSGFSGSGDSYSFTLTPQADGAFSAQVTPGIFADPAGNLNTGSNVLSRKFDGTAPGISLTCTAGDPVNGAITVDVVLTEDNTTFDASDIAVDNAVVSDFIGSNTMFSFTLTALSEGPFSVWVDALMFSDAVGNLNTVSNTVLRTYDNTAPGLTLTCIAGDPVNGPVTIEVQLTESVVTFDATDISVDNATVSDFTGFDDAYSFTLSPVSEGSFSAWVNAAVFEDLADNTNTASNAVLRTYDGTRPGILLDSLSVNPVNGAITVEVTVTESVSTLDETDVAVSNAVLSGFIGSGDTYSFVLTPILDGQFTASVPGNVFSDAAGNLNTASNMLSRLYDGTAPSIQTRIPPANALIGWLNTVQVVFFEPVTGLQAGDLSVNGSAAATLTGSGVGPYEFSGFTLPGDGAVHVTLAPGATQDAAGNAFAGDSWDYTVNSHLTTVALTSSDVFDGGVTNAAQPIRMTVTFSEPVNGFTVDDILATNVLSPLLDFAGTDDVYTFSVIPLSDGPVTIQVPGDIANTVAVPHNPNAESPVFTFICDSRPPVITIKGDLTATVDCGEGYVDPGILSAVDTLDGDLTAFVIASGDVVTEFSPPSGSPYEIVYTVSDRAGNIGQATRTVIVLENCPLEVLAIGSTNIRVEEEGDEVQLRVVAVFAIGPVHYNWQVSDQNGDYHDIGAPDSPLLILSDFGLNDQGHYRCEVSDALTTKTSPEFYVRLAINGVPVAGTLGLSAIVGLTALIGVWRLRRKCA